MGPLVSIIIPNYNHATYLHERIESILNQTFKDYEIIILDDFSTDNSKEIINEYQNHPRISHIIYNNINSGSTFVQWNRGFNLAKGKYIWIAESDDFCEKDMLEVLVNNINKQSNNVLAFCLSQFVNSNGNKINPFLKTSKNIIISGNKFISNYMTFENAIHNASSAIFKKDCLSVITSDYTKFKAAGDRLFWIEIAKQGNVAIVNTPLNYFRQHKIKVSPAKLIDGTTFKEDYLIFSYLRSLNYINKYQNFFIKNHYTNEIYKVKEMSATKKNEMLHLWNNTISNYRILVAFIDLLYKYIIKLQNKLFI